MTTSNNNSLSEKQEQSNGPSSQKPYFRAPQESFTASDFVYGKLLGLGSYSKVVKATKKDTGVTYALKIMDKHHIVKENKTSYVKLERIILDQLDHPGIIRLFFTFQDAHYLYMGLECCDGGELFDQIQRKKRLTMEEARFYAAELVEVMEYLHGQGLIHRDLKPENLLLTNEGHLKVADFGSAKALRPFTNQLIQNLPDDKSYNFVGTAEYVSPEVLNSHPIGIGVDFWALGCIVYQMLVGRPPFKCATEYLTFQKVMARDFTFPDFLPSEAKDLIDKLLDLDPNKRPGVGPDGYAVLKAHPFFHGVDWSQLRKTSAPSVAPPPPENLEDGSTSDDEVDNTLDPEWAFAHIGASVNDNMNQSELGAVQSKLNNLHVNRTSPRTADGTSKTTAVASVTTTPSSCGNDEQWNGCNSTNEKHRMINLLKKCTKLFIKKENVNTSKDEKKPAISSGR